MDFYEWRQSDMSQPSAESFVIAAENFSLTPSAMGQAGHPFRHQFNQILRPQVARRSAFTDTAVSSL